MTVTSDGSPAGIVVPEALAAVPEERRPWVTVASVARSLQEGLSLPADLRGEALIVALGRTHAGEYVLLDADGSVFGVLAVSDVDRAFREAARR